jgi:integrase
MATLFYRKDREEYWAHVMVNGRRVRRKLHSNKREAEQRLAKLLLELRGSQRTTQTDDQLTLGDFIEQDYLPWARAHKATATVKREELAMKTWTGVVGDGPMATITRRQAERYRTARRITPSKRTGRPLSARSINHDVGVISFVLGKAVEWEILANNSLIGLKRLPENKKAPRWLTSEEVDALMDVLPDRLRAVVVTALNTGLRRGELRRLQWSDVDLQRRVLMVRHKGEEHTKSRKERVVDLNDVAVETLRLHRVATRRTFGKVPVAVFVTEDGTAIGNNLLRDLKAVYKLAGIEAANVHTLRHTFGAHAAMAGVPMPTLKELMGHADIKTTMVYVHVDRQHQAEAVNRISLGTPRREANVVPLAAARGAASGSETGSSRTRMPPKCHQTGVSRVEEV